MNIKGYFTRIGEFHCPLPGIIETDNETQEVTNIVTSKVTINNLAGGTEFRFVADNGEIYLDDWSPTKDTNSCASRPLFLVNEPSDTEDIT